MKTTCPDCESDNTLELEPFYALDENGDETSKIDGWSYECNDCDCHFDTYANH